MILSSWGRLRPSEARVKRSHEDKITFSLAYRTQFFHTTCANLDLVHAVLFERAQSDSLRTECEKIMFDTRAKNDSLTSVIVTLASLGQQTHTCGRIFFIALVSKITIFYSSVLKIELCARSVTIVIFDTSTLKWFYPRGGCLRPSEARVKRPHEDKITFSLKYRTQFFDTTCGKVNFGHAFLLERVQNRALRTECENIIFSYYRAQSSSLRTHMRSQNVSFPHTQPTWPNDKYACATLWWMF